MSDFLLAAVNSKYSHTNIAIRYLKLFAKKRIPEADFSVDFGEWTINQPIGEIIRGILVRKPKAVFFSTYVWNVSQIEILIQNLKAIQPELLIGCGGPEVSFRGPDFLQKNLSCDIVMKGEGEQTFCELVKKLSVLTVSDSPFNLNINQVSSTIKTVKGLYFRESNGNIFFTGEQPLICDMGQVPFPYEEDLYSLDPDHKIFYYESSRGCPFSCAYCMSSLDTKVRFVPLSKVYEDLQKFLDAKVALVKFVDRTYNLQPERYIGIWKYIVDHHNGKTMFHFEIEGEFLSPEAVAYLQTVPKGIMQFEIGVQSSNPKVLKAVGRSPETEKLKANILSIPKTIHSHLDLIAGLPYENLESFGRSFNFVMNIKPDAMQLGFLKILYGAPIGSFCAENDWRWMPTPPYEVMSTPYLSYNEILFLKDLEKLLDEYWNTHVFDTTMIYLAQKLDWWTIFSLLTKKYQANGCFTDARNHEYWASKLFENLPWLSSEAGLAQKETKIASELFRFDYISQGKKTNPPAWLKRTFDKDRHYAALMQTTGINNARIDFAFSDFETFSINPFAPEEETTDSAGTKEYHVLFFYEGRGSANKKHAQLVDFSQQIAK